MWESSRPLIVAGNSFDEGMSMSQPAPFSIFFVQMKPASDLFLPRANILPRCWVLSFLYFLFIKRHIQFLHIPPAIVSSSTSSLRIITANEFV